MGKNVYLHKLVRRLGEEEGRIGFVAILLILLVAAAIYSAVLFIPPYVEYYKLKEKVNAVANMAHREHDEKVLLDELMRESKELNLDLPYDAFKIQRDPQGKFLEFTVKWARVVELKPLGKEVTLHFEIGVVEEL